MPVPDAAGAPRGRRIEDLRVLYDVHGAEIHRFCRRVLLDDGLAEEATQETFLRAWRHGDRFDPEAGSQRTWIFAIARNVCLDQLRFDARRPARAAPPPALGQHEGGATTGGIEDVTSAWMLSEALSRLSDDHRSAVVATVVRDRPYRETAEALGVPEATLRTRVFHGLRALRRSLEEMGWHE